MQTVVGLGIVKAPLESTAPQGPAESAQSQTSEKDMPCLLLKPGSTKRGM